MLAALGMQPQLLASGALVHLAGQVQGAAAWSLHAWQQANCGPHGSGSSTSSSNTQPASNPAGRGNAPSPGPPWQSRSISNSSSPHDQHGLAAAATLSSQGTSSKPSWGVLPQAGRWLSSGRLHLAPTSNPWFPAAGSSRSAATLAYDQYYISKDTLAPVEAHKVEDVAKAANPPPLTAVFLHGLLGSSKNWRSFAKSLAVAAAKEQQRDVHVLMPDLRNHGRSTWVKGIHPPHTLEAAAADVRHFLHTHVRGGMPHLLIGLSLGGKVALEVLAQLSEPNGPREVLVGLKPRQQQEQQKVEEQGPTGQEAAEEEVRRLPQQVWVLDSQPSTVPLDDESPNSVASILGLIRSIPQPVASRGDLYSTLAAQGVSQAVAWWLGSALAPDDRGQLRWAFNIQGAGAMFHSYRLSSYLDVLSFPPPGTVIHLVRGQKSDRWTPKMLKQLTQCKERCGAIKATGQRVGDLHLHMLPDAGHWLHADNPAGLQAMILPWVKCEADITLEL